MDRAKKIRVTFEVDVSNETIWSDEMDGNGLYTRVPVTAENALAWYLYAFDAYESNYKEGFVTNTKVEVIETLKVEPEEPKLESLGDILERELNKLREPTDE